MNNEQIGKMARVVAASRCLLSVREHPLNPEFDALAQRASFAELRTALAALDHSYEQPMGTMGTSFGLDVASLPCL